MSAAPFDPLRLLKTLDRHGVRFVVIGGIAGRLWGSTTVTNVLDICYGRDRANLAALANALRDLKVKLRGVGADLKFIADARTLENGDLLSIDIGTTLEGYVSDSAVTVGIGEVGRDAPEPITLASEGFDHPLGTGRVSPPSLLGVMRRPRLHDHAGAVGQHALSYPEADPQPSAYPGDESNPPGRRQR